MKISKVAQQSLLINRYYYYYYYYYYYRYHIHKDSQKYCHVLRLDPVSNLSMLPSEFRRGNLLTADQL